MTTINFSKVLYVTEHKEEQYNFIYYRYYFSEKDYMTNLDKKTYDLYLKYINKVNNQPFDTTDYTLQLNQLISKIDDLFQFFIGKQSFENNFIFDNK